VARAGSAEGGCSAALAAAQHACGRRAAPLPATVAGPRQRCRQRPEDALASLLRWASAGQHDPAASGALLPDMPGTDGAHMRASQPAVPALAGGRDITASGGLQPDVACSDYPHGGLPTPADDRCIAAALKLLARHG